MPRTRRAIFAFALLLAGAARIDAADWKPIDPALFDILDGVQRLTASNGNRSKGSRRLSPARIRQSGKLFL